MFLFKESPNSLNLFRNGSNDLRNLAQMLILVSLFVVACTKENPLNPLESATDGFLNDEHHQQDDTLLSFSTLFGFRPLNLFYVDTEGVSPDFGSINGGNEVTLKGFNFSSQLTVEFGALPASCKVKSSYEMACITPPSSPGTVDIKVSDKTTPQMFSYHIRQGYTYYEPPAISSISNKLINSKKNLYTVTLKGSNLNVPNSSTEVRMDGSQISNCKIKSKKILCHRVNGTPGKTFSMVIKMERLGKVKETSMWSEGPPPTDDSEDPDGNGDTDPELPIVDLIERPTQTISYQTISYQTDISQNFRDLYPWVGRNIALLTSTSDDLDQEAMSRLIDAFDRAYDYYKETLGFEPLVYSRGNHQDRTTIAVVNNSCGAGCGWVGYDGIEITTSIFTDSYQSILSNHEVGQTVFYELGRNFYRVSDKIGYVEDSSKGEADPVGTGFAIYMRFKSMEAIDAHGAPFKNVDFDEFRAEVESLVNSYETDPIWTWENTLKIGKSPKDRKSLGLGATDLWAAFLFRIERNHTFESLKADFAKNFFKEISLRNKVVTTQDAIDNFIVAACSASQKNLISQFVDNWRWPLSLTAQEEIEARFPSVPSQK